MQVSSFAAAAHDLKILFQPTVVTYSHFPFETSRTWFQHYKSIRTSKTAAFDFSLHYVHQNANSNSRSQLFGKLKANKTIFSFMKALPGQFFKQSSRLQNITVRGRFQNCESVKIYLSPGKTIAVVAK